MTTITEPIESEIEREHETERVLRWRSQELRRAGYQPADALILALRTMSTSTWRPTCSRADRARTQAPHPCPRSDAADQLAVRRTHPVEGCSLRVPRVSWGASCCGFLSCGRPASRRG